MKNCIILYHPKKTVVFLLYSPPSLFSTDPSSKNGCRLDAQLDGWTPATLSGPSKQPIFVWVSRNPDLELRKDVELVESSESSQIFRELIFHQKLANQSVTMCSMNMIYIYDICVYNDIYIYICVYIYVSYTYNINIYMSMYMYHTHICNII